MRRRGKAYIITWKQVCTGEAGGGRGAGKRQGKAGKRQGEVRRQGRGRGGMGR